MFYMYVVCGHMHWVSISGIGTAVPCVRLALACMLEFVGLILAHSTNKSGMYPPCVYIESANSWHFFSFSNHECSVLNTE